MSTPEQPNTPPLTRRRLREIRTGAFPIIDPEALETPHETEEDTFVSQRPAPTAEGDQDSAAPRPRPATSVAVPPAPGPDAGVDLGVSPLTRRQARQQERIRTASVPVITPDMEAQFASDAAAQGAEKDSRPATDHGDMPTIDAEEAPVEHEASADRASATGTDDSAEQATADDGHGVEAEIVPDTAAGDRIAAVPAGVRSADEDAEPLVLVPVADSGTGERPVVAAEFGAELLAGEPPRADLPPTFDQLISRETSTAGSVATPNALILSQTPSAGPLTGPIAATGEVLITGTYDLPEGLGSTGHAAGTADGKEVDAVLVDGELPAHSSPTPISASAAISTVKTEGEIIRPPAPEKGSRLMVTLAITAGALGLALVGVLIFAITTGVFS